MHPADCKKLLKFSTEARNTKTALNFDDKQQEGLFYETGVACVTIASIIHYSLQQGQKTGSRLRYKIQHRVPRFANMSVKRAPTAFAGSYRSATANRGQTPKADGKWEVGNRMVVCLNGAPYIGEIHDLAPKHAGVDTVTFGWENNCQQKDFLQPFCNDMSRRHNRRRADDVRDVEDEVRLTVCCSLQRSADLWTEGVVDGQFQLPSTGVVARSEVGWYDPEKGEKGEWMVCLVRTMLEKRGTSLGRCEKETVVFRGKGDVSLPEDVDGYCMARFPQGGTDRPVWEPGVVRDYRKLADSSEAELLILGDGGKASWVKRSHVMNEVFEKNDRVEMDNGGVWDSVYIYSCDTRNLKYDVVDGKGVNKVGVEHDKPRSVRFQKNDTVECLQDGRWLMGNFASTCGNDQAMVSVLMEGGENGRPVENWGVNDVRKTKRRATTTPTMPRETKRQCKAEVEASTNMVRVAMSLKGSEEGPDQKEFWNRVNEALGTLPIDVLKDLLLEQVRGRKHVGSGL